MFDPNEVFEAIRTKLKEREAERVSKYQPLPNEIRNWLNSKFLSFGRMVSATKRDAKPETVFNANLVCKTYGKMWFGDLLMNDSDKDYIQELANLVKEPVYVLREHDCRFDTEVNPVFENAVLIIEPTVIQ